MTDPTFDVFVSYCWDKDEEGRDNKARVDSLVSLLRSQGLSVWQDTTNMQGDVQEAMIEGITDSKVFVVVATKKYVDKVNAGRAMNVHREFRFGVKQRPFVPIMFEPVMLDDDIRNQGTYSFFVMDELWVNMSTDDAMEANLGQLVTMIRSKIN